MWLVHCAGTVVAQSITVDTMTGPIKFPSVDFFPKLLLSALAQNSQAKEAFH